MLQFDEDDIKVIAEHLSPANTPRLNSTYTGPRGSASYILILVNLNPLNAYVDSDWPLLCKKISEDNSSALYGATGNLLPMQNAVPLQRIGKEVSNTTHSPLTTAKGSPECSDEQDVLAYVAGQPGYSYFSIFITDIENNVPSDDNLDPWSDPGNRPWIRVGLDRYEVGNLDNNDCVHGHSTAIHVDLSGCYFKDLLTAALAVSIDVFPENLTCTVKDGRIGYLKDPDSEDLHHEIVLKAESREMVFQRNCDQTGAFELKFTQTAVEMIAKHLSSQNTPKLNASYAGLRGSANYVLLEVTLEPVDNSEPVDPMPALCGDISSYYKVIKGADGEPFPEEVQYAAPLQVIDLEVSNVVQSSSTVSGSETNPDERDVVAYVWGQDGDSRFYIYIVDIENNMFHIDNPEPWSDENNWPWIKVGLNPDEEDDEDWFNGIRRTIWVDVSGYDSADIQAALHVSVNSTVEDLTCRSTNSQIGHFDDGLVAIFRSMESPRTKAVSRTTGWNMAAWIMYKAYTARPRVSMV